MFFSSTSFGNAGQFLPKIYSVGGVLDINASHTHTTNVTPSGGLRTTDTALEERLRFFAVGYVYHPRFISFRGFIGGVLRDEKFTSNTGNTSSRWTLSSSDEYGLTVRILPRHPYSLELYTERHTPLTQVRVSSSYKSVYYDRGAIFRYKKRASSLTLSTTQNISEYESYRVNSVTHAADGAYSIGPFMNTAGQSVTESVTSSSQARTIQTASYFNNTLHFRDANFASHIDVRNLVQENPVSASQHNDNVLTWTEEARLVLPWNFRTSGGYRLNEQTMTQRPTNTASERTFSRETENTHFAVSHRLYNNLSTSYNINNSSSLSTGGDMKTTSKGFSANYTKMIPWGRFLTGTFVQRSLTDIKNAPTIPDEIHTITVTGSGSCSTGVDCFDLDNQSVDISSIIVQVRSKTTNEIITLAGTYYTVDQPGSAVRITITSLPSGFVTPDIYEFHVTYSFISQMVKYETTSSGYTVAFELFNNFINPHYGHSKSDQEVLSGTLEGGPQHMSSESMGVSVLKQPYTFTTDYQSTTSNLNPSRVFKSTAGYRETIAPNTSLNAKVHYTTITRQSAVTSSEDTLGADAHLQKNVPRKNLSLALGVSYAHRSAFSTTETYSLNSYLSWKIGKLLISMSASVSESVITSAGVKNVSVNEQYYLTLSRRLF